MRVSPPARQSVGAGFKPAPTTTLHEIDAPIIKNPVQGWLGGSYPRRGSWLGSCAGWKMESGPGNSCDSASRFLEPKPTSPVDTPANAVTPSPSFTRKLRRDSPCPSLEEVNGHSPRVAGPSPAKFLLSQLYRLSPNLQTGPIIPSRAIAYEPLIPAISIVVGIWRPQ